MYLLNLSSLLAVAPLLLPNPLLPLPPVPDLQQRGIRVDGVGGGEGEGHQQPWGLRFIIQQNSIAVDNFRAMEPWEPFWHPLKLP